MHPPKFHQALDEESTATEYALELWKTHRQGLHNSAYYAPNNGSITYTSSMVGATGRSQIEQFAKLFPAKEHPIKHPENRILSRSISFLDLSANSFRITEEIMINFEHTEPIDFFLPNVPITKKSAFIPVVFVVEYSSELIQNVRIHWDQLMLAAGLQIPLELVKSVLLKQVNWELMLKRTIKPSPDDFQEVLDERRAELAAQQAALMQRNQSSKRDLPISKRSSINDIVFSPIAEGSADEQVNKLDTTMNSMCITPMRGRDENKILGIGPSKYLSSNLFKGESDEVSDSIKPPNLSLATPVHQSKIGRFSVSKSRIFGDSECESEPQSPVTSKPPSIGVNTAHRIWGQEDNEVGGQAEPTRQVSKNLQSKVFDQEGSPFYPSLKINSSKPISSLEQCEEDRFLPSLGGTQAHDALKESPLVESEMPIQPTTRRNLRSNIELGHDGCEENAAVASRPVTARNQNISQIQFGSDE